VHLIERSQGLGEVLERGLAKNQVEGTDFEGNACRITVPELDIDARSRAFSRATVTNVRLMSSPVT